MKTPTLNKWGRIYKDWDKLMEFLEWLDREGKNINIQTNRALLSEYFKIDLGKLDDERRALLEEIRK